jgi:hypothetical protein
MKAKPNSHYNSTIIIYHHEIDLEYLNGNTFWAITEIVNTEPVQTYFYKIPDDYKNNKLLGNLHERYAPYCPN